MAIPTMGSSSSAALLEIVWGRREVQCREEGRRVGVGGGGGCGGRGRGSGGRRKVGLGLDELSVKTQTALVNLSTRETLRAIQCSTLAGLYIR